MKITEKESELVHKYLNGEYTEVQLNWLMHQNGITTARLEAVSEWISYHDPIKRAFKSFAIFLVFISLFKIFGCVFLGLPF